jgi:hypothetical protein
MTEKSNGKKKAKLTVRQSRLLKAIPHSKTLSEAGAKAGFSCRQSAHESFQAIAEKAPEVLQRLGLTTEYVLDKYLRPLLEAKETKFFQNQGIVMQEKEVDALDIRLRAIDTWAKLAGAYSIQKVNVNGNLSVDVSNVSDDELDQSIANLLGKSEPETKA